MVATTLWVFKPVRMLRRHWCTLAGCVEWRREVVDVLVVTAKLYVFQEVAVDMVVLCLEQDDRRSGTEKSRHGGWRVGNRV